MNISLKELISQPELKIQIYCDLDGVLVDMDKGFKAISGGYTPKNFKDAPQFAGNEQAARKEFWKLIGRHPRFWHDLEPMPDAMVLWKYISETFKTPAPVILSAGQGANILAGKTHWVRQHISPTVKVILSPGGVKKPLHIIHQENTTHILVDDTQKNIDAWNNGSNQIAILHKNAAESIRLLGEIK